MVVNQRYFKPGIAGAAKLMYGAYSGFKTNTGMKGYRSFTRTKTKYRRRPAKTFSMKKYVLSAAPAKHLPLNDITVVPTHSTIYSLSPTQTIARGVNNDQRIGDSVHLLSLKVSGFFRSQVINSKACHYRMMVLWSGEEYSCPTSWTTPALTTTEIFINNGTAWTPNNIVNPKAVTVLDDREITLNNSITGVADLESFNYSVPLNCDFDYQAAGSVYGKTRNLYVVLTCATIDGVLATDQVGTVSVCFDLVFK